MVQIKLKILLENIINDIENNDQITIVDIINKMSVQIKNENLII